MATWRECVQWEGTLFESSIIVFLERLPLEVVTQTDKQTARVEVHLKFITCLEQELYTIIIVIILYIITSKQV